MSGWSAKNLACLDIEELQQSLVHARRDKDENTSNKTDYNDNAQDENNALKKQMSQLQLEFENLKGSFSILQKKQKDMELKEDELCEVLKAKDEPKDEDTEDVFAIETRKKKKQILMGMSTFNQDTYTLMMLSDHIKDTSWIFGFTVFLFQLALGSLTLYSQVQSSTTESDYNNTFLQIPIHVKTSVSALQGFSIMIAVLCQEDVFNAIALPIDLRWNGHNRWGGIPINDNDDRRNSFLYWVFKVPLPNIFKFVQGGVVLAAFVIVILQSKEVIDLLKDFTALYVMSYIDDMIFSIIRRGFFGTTLLDKALDVELIDIEGESRFEEVQAEEDERQGDAHKRNNPRNSLHSTKTTSFGDKFKSILLFSILTAGVISWIVVLVSQERGMFAAQKYPGCKNEVGENFFNSNWTLLENNNCDMIFNNRACGFDGDDCAEFNLRFPDCKNTQLISGKVGNRVCDGYPYNSEECLYDGGDCREEAPYCNSTAIGTFGDGQCDNELNVWECQFDGGDCLTPEAIDSIINFNDLLESDEFDNVNNVDPLKPGDGICNLFYNDESVKYTAYDGGDCIHPRFEGCFFFSYNTNFKDEIGDGKCHNDEYHNTKECGWDGGDCIVGGFPNCRVDDPKLIRNNECNGGEYNTEECGWDGGDCIEFNANYPNCVVDRPSLIENGYCNVGEYNTIDCEWDGGDCLVDGYPNCRVDDPKLIGNQVCNGGVYNTEECGFDGGDCELINSTPDCKVWGFSSYIGNGDCEKVTNNEECGWDGGDCIEFNQKYPNCEVDFPYLVGDDVCDGGKYFTEECGWDGGDCVEFKQKYPNCNVYYPSWIGDGKCDGGEYYTEECGYEDGDCP